MLRPTSLPWAKPKRELLLLALVAVAALSPAFIVSTQDISHFCLSRALLSGDLTIEPCAGFTIDRSIYHGRIYTNKAPGMSILAVPAAAALRLPSAEKWTNDADPRLWGVRLLTSGVAFLVCAFLVGRVCEGLVAGSGPPALVTLGLGTLMGPFAATGFDHVLTAAFGFGAFVLAWSGRPGLAGLAAGIAYALEYQGAALVLIVGLYVLLRGARPLGRFAAGVVPGVAVSAGYSWAAFGAPWRNPHSYLMAHFAGVNENSGLLGVALPTLGGARIVLTGDRGLLVASPVLFAAAAGLWFFWRRGRPAEALACTLVAAAFVLGDCGYGDPDGGLSPGPRYIVPALPFLALGLAFVFNRVRTITAALAAVSIAANTILTLSWAKSGDLNYRYTIWGELVRSFHEGSSSRLARELAASPLVWLGVGRIGAAAVLAATAAAAYAISLRTR